MPVLRRKGVDLHYEVYGEGPPLLLTHGYSATGQMWAGQIAALVVVGAEDTPFPVASDYMANKIPNAKRVVIPQAGHAVNIDQPAAFNVAVTDFLASIEAR